MKNFLKHIEEKVKKNITIEKINILDNSDKHKKHKFYDVNKYHLSLEIESRQLRSMSRLSAQRKIMRILNQEIRDKIHALEINIK